jgi:hypothetical protein
MAEADLKAPEIREDGLQLEEHRSFQERFWVVERIAWIAFGVLLLAALVGLTGSGGPLSRTVTSLEGGTIDFPHIMRWEAADEIVVRFAPGAAERSLTLSSGFAEAFQIEDIQPQPSGSVAGAGGAVMMFETEAAAPAEVTLHVTPLKPGWPTVNASIGDGAAASLSMLVLP